MLTHPIVLFLFLTVFWACSSGDARSAQGSSKLLHASTASKPSPRSRSAGTCPLSPTEQIEAAKRFEQLMPVLQHPRCANCHGGIDFFSAGYEDLHGGGAVEMVDREVKGPDGSIIAQRRPDFATCASCHDAQTRRRWEIPAPMLNVNFAGRTAAQICEHMKRHSQNPNNLLRHIDADELIRLGFEGRRGLTSLSPLPPPMTAESFNAKVSDWIVAMKVQDEWPTPLSCGCVAPDMRYRVTVHFRTHTENYGEIGNILYNAELRPDSTDPTQLIGTGRYSGSVISRKLNCHSNEPEQKRTHVVSGNLDASGGVAEWPGGRTQFMYRLATTDWPLLPLVGDELGSDPEWKEIAKGLGSISGPLLGVPLQGQVTKTLEQSSGGDLFQKNDCTGNITTTEDITITDLSSASTGPTAR